MNTVRDPLVRASHGRALEITTDLASAGRIALSIPVSRLPGMIIAFGNCIEAFRERNPQVVAVVVVASAQSRFRLA